MPAARRFVLLSVFALATAVKPASTAPPPGSAGVAATGHEPGRDRAPFAAGEIIVRLRDHVMPTFGGERAGESTEIAPRQTGISSLDELNRVFGARSMKPLFPVLVTELREREQTAQQHLAAVRTRFPKRASRAPSSDCPDLTTIYVLTFAASADVVDLCRAYERDPHVAWAEPNYIIEPADRPAEQSGPESTTSDFVMPLPDDTYVDPDRDGAWSEHAWGQSYADMWGLRRIGMRYGWSICRGDSTIVVGISDSGIDYTHRDIQDNLWRNEQEWGGLPGIDDDGNGYVDDVYGYDFTTCEQWLFNGRPYCLDRKDPDSDPYDDYGHGTNVAGTVAATTDNEEGVAGVAWHARLMAVRGLNPWGFLGDLSRTIRYATDNGADVINMSWGGGGNSITVREALQYARATGVVLVASAGNHTGGPVTYPAANHEVIAVAAWSAQDDHPSWSSTGPKVELTAPGHNILSLRPPNTPCCGSSLPDDPGYSRMSGTSAAAPHVTGLVALILSLDQETSTNRVRTILHHAAEDVLDAGRDIQTGYGLIDARATLTLASNPYVLIRNGDFSTDSGIDFFPDRNDDDATAINLYPDGWTSGGRDPHILDHHVSRNGPDADYRQGRYPAALHHDLSRGLSRRNYDCWYVPVKEGNTYFVEAWLKATDLEHGGATLIFETADDHYATTAWGDVLYPVDESRWLTHTTDWSQRTYRVTIPHTTPRTAYLRLLCYTLELPFGGTGPNPTGHAYFDNIIVLGRIDAITTPSGGRDDFVAAQGVDAKDGDERVTASPAREAPAGEPSVPEDRERHARRILVRNSGSGTVRLDVADAAPATVEIYDSLGRLVDVVTMRHESRWPRSGQRAAGVYYARLRDRTRPWVTKFVLVK